MENRYLFRVWDTEENRMITDTQEFTPVIVTSKGVLRMSPCHEETLYNLIPFGDRFIPMQCTGVPDKYGKLIFEGDIIRTHYANAPKADHVEQVVFRDGKFMAELQLSDTGRCWAPLANGIPRLMTDTSVYMEWCEIIGSIHDNPELLVEGRASDAASDR